MGTVSIFTDQRSKAFISVTMKFCVNIKVITLYLLCTVYSTMHHVDKRCEKLKRERDWYREEYLSLTERIHWKQNVGLYTREDNTLVLHYSKDKDFFPYGNIAWEPRAFSGTIRVKGSWDNWQKVYTLYREVLKEEDMFIGYIYYIVLTADLYDRIWQFKLIDTDGTWIEPVEEDQCYTEEDIADGLYEEEDGVPKVGDLKGDGGMYIHVTQENGIWNAIVRVKYPGGIHPWKENRLEDINP